jgi:pimeloyl-ACP methyl ester carboxylesterase
MVPCGRRHRGDRRDLSGATRFIPAETVRTQPRISAPRDVLARIAVPTVLIWGRHDLQTGLSVAESASARYSWPLHVIEGARDDPFFEQPEAAMHALRASLS